MKFNSEVVKDETGKIVGSRYTIKPEDFSNELNGKRYLIFHRRGCNFYRGDRNVEKSDVGNHRVFTAFRAADNGAIICGDFMHGLRYRYLSLRKSKETGAPWRLKTPILIDDLALHTDLEYDGYATCNGKKEFGSWGIIVEKRWGIPYGELDFTKAGILEFVNRVADRHYDEIIIAKHPHRDDLGYREREVLEHLTRMEVVQDDGNYLVVRFWHENGEDFFDVEQNSMRVTG